MSTESRYIGSLSPEHAVLGMLALQPDHGYELHQRLTTQLGKIWHISQSQVYNILKRLENRGDITGSLKEQTKLPNRLLYQLTPTGRARFNTWLETPTRCSLRAIRVEFITRLFFASQQNQDRVGGMITSQAIEISRGLSRLKKLMDELPPEDIFNHLGMELRINQLSSTLEWLEKCQSLINRQLNGQEFEPK